MHHMKDVKCLSASEVAAALAEEQAQASSVLWDIVEFADAAGAESLHVMLDCRQHGQQSLLQPGLSGFQGPALCIAIPGTLLFSFPSAQACRVFYPVLILSF